MPARKRLPFIDGPGLRSRGDSPLWMDPQEVETMETVGSSSPGFRGMVQLRLSDLIQMVCLARSDLVVQVRSGDRNGSIFVKEGRIYHAETARLNGEEAFFEIFRWEDGHFEALPEGENKPPSIQKPWEHLLLEAVRRRDEGSPEGKGPDPGEEAGPERALEASPGAEGVWVEPPWLEEGIDRAIDGLEAIPGASPDFKPSEAANPRELHRLQVLVVDDSAFFARQLKSLLEKDGAIEVVGVARNGRDALEILASGPYPDVVTLDAHMPVMPGDTTLKHIMIRHPVPVLILSSFEERSVESIFEFLEVGAVDLFSKPRASDDGEEFGRRLREQVQRVSRARVARFRRRRKRTILQDPGVRRPSERILAILGAEGAHLEWLRLPLLSLCRQGIVFGFQRISRAFLEGFGRFIEEGCSVPTRLLEAGSVSRPGTFCLGTGNEGLNPQWRPGDSSLTWGPGDETGETWSQAVGTRLAALSSLARGRLDVHVLSSAEPFEPALAEALLASGTRFFLSPPDSVLCEDMVRAVEPYEAAFPNQVLFHGPETLMEAWLDHETAV